MRIRELRMDFSDGVAVSVWTICETKDDCDEMIAWLQLAKANMKQWEKIHAKASRASKAPISKNEAAQQGEVLSAA